MLQCVPCSSLLNVEKRTLYVHLQCASTRWNKFYTLFPAINNQPQTGGNSSGNALLEGNQISTISGGERKNAKLTNMTKATSRVVYVKEKCKSGLTILAITVGKWTASTPCVAFSLCELSCKSERIRCKPKSCLSKEMMAT